MIPVSKPVISADERKRVDDVLRSGMIASGPVVAEFEQKFTAAHECRFGVATSNGTTALHAALLACGIAPGDKVLTTPFTFIASTNSIAFCGALPVFADIERETFNLDPAAARTALISTPGIKAILLVHLYGLPCDMDAFIELKREFGVVIIEDCAQAHGAAYKSRKVGGIGDVGIFSFYATKNITTGEGGMVVTNSEAIAARTRKLVNHGRQGRYEHDQLGYNFRMTDIAAAIGLGQLEKLPANNARRQAIAAEYDEALASHPGLKLPSAPADRTHVYHQYTLRSQDRDRLKSHLDDRGVGSFVVYPVPSCGQPLYRGKCGCPPDEPPKCREATMASKEVLSIPVHPHLTREEVRTVIGAIGSFR